MIATSEGLEKWLFHASEKVPLERDPNLGIIEKAAELNKRGGEIIDTFGQRQFSAAVGFIDMRGFSDLAKAKSPSEVRDIAGPFVEAIVDVATQHHGFIDKTIGDEVMIVLPDFPGDAVVSKAGLPRRNLMTIEIAKLVGALATRAPDRRFSSGFAIGEVILDRVGGDGYGEWTVYGNTVNAAKRLQSIKPMEGSPLVSADLNLLAVGAIEAEYPEIHNNLSNLQLLWPNPGRPEMISATIERREFKGVGPLTYFTCGLLGAGKRDG
jgi:class 3 adenylate cyclase